jgi:MYXO-CTERM domain-containing protein
VIRAADINEVPEPASLALWSLMSVAGLAAWRRREKRKGQA